MYDTYSTYEVPGTYVGVRKVQYIRYRTYELVQYVEVDTVGKVDYIPYHTYLTEGTIGTYEYIITGCTYSNYYARVRYKRAKQSFLN